MDAPEPSVTHIHLGMGRQQCLKNKHCKWKSSKSLNIGPEKWWLEDYTILLGFGLFSEAFAVSFREGIEWFPLFCLNKMSKELNMVTRIWLNVFQRYTLSICILAWGNCMETWRTIGNRGCCNYWCKAIVDVITDEPFSPYINRLRGVAYMSTSTQPEQVDMN